MIESHFRVPERQAKPVVRRRPVECRKPSAVEEAKERWNTELGREGHCRHVLGSREGLARNERTAEAIVVVSRAVKHAGFRRQGVSYALARAAVGFARGRGARALEGYPMVPEVGRDVPWGEMSVGAQSVFEAAGFKVVSRPGPRRVVLRVELRAG